MWVGVGLEGGSRGGWQSGWVGVGLEGGSRGGLVLKWWWGHEIVGRWVIVLDMLMI